MTTKPDIKSGYIVLLAEDDIDDQEMLIDALRQLDSEIHFLVANTGSKAVELLKTLPAHQEPSVIVLDYNLPEMSGAEILARIREMRRFDKITKIVWSTSNSPVYQRKCLELGAESYIVKPNGIAGIREIARQLFEICAREVAH